MRKEDARRESARRRKSKNLPSALSPNSCAALVFFHFKSSELIVEGFDGLVSLLDGCRALAGTLFFVPAFDAGDLKRALAQLRVNLGAELAALA